MSNVVAARNKVELQRADCVVSQGPVQVVKKFNKTVRPVGPSTEIGRGSDQDFIS
ncbi:hypothetical protein J6590_000474 [Homalodisca vitripennis]|nr:hypothetical protein J6590_000474 [Homalodisca vitripennis]